MRFLHLEGGLPSNVQFRHARRCRSASPAIRLRMSMDSIPTPQGIPCGYWGSTFSRVNLEEPMFLVNLEKIIESPHVIQQDLQSFLHYGRRAWCKANIDQHPENPVGQKSDVM